MDAERDLDVRNSAPEKMLEAGKLFEQAGSKEHTKETYKKAASMYLERIKLGGDYARPIALGHAAEAFKKVGMQKELNDTLELIKRHKVGDLEYHADELEKAEKFMKAKTIRKRARQLENSKDLGSLLSEIIGVAGVLAGIFFLSPNLTGNAISNMTNSTSNILGSVLLVIGLIGGFFWMKSRKKK
jgi:hypothetical protein